MTFAIGSNTLAVVSDDLDVLDEYRPAWMRAAACREHPMSSFFPASGVKADAARALCERCVVRPECLAYAIANECVGIWAGTTAPERRKIGRTAA